MLGIAARLPRARSRRSQPGRRSQASMPWAILPGLDSAPARPRWGARHGRGGVSPPAGLAAVRTSFRAGKPHPSIDWYQSPKAPCAIRASVLGSANPSRLVSGPPRITSKVARRSAAVPPRSGGLLSLHLGSYSWMLAHALCLRVRACPQSSVRGPRRQRMAGPGKSDRGVEVCPSCGSSRQSMRKRHCTPLFLSGISSRRA